MKELSLHILDIAQNSIRGKADEIVIDIKELPKDNLFEFTICDNGTGIPEDIFKDIKNPFTTTRVTRKVGLGIPLLDSTCKNCNGRLTLETSKEKGTRVHAVMEYNHIDRPPLGDIASTISMLISSYSDINFDYKHMYNEESFAISTETIKGVLGDEVPLTELSVIKWLKNYVIESLDEIKK